MDEVRAELPAGADGDGARELVLRDGLVRQSVHPHRNLKSIESCQFSPDGKSDGKNSAEVDDGFANTNPAI